MDNYKKIDMQSWDRASLYRSFMEFQNPFINMSTRLKIENLYRYSKENEISFFQLTAYAILKATNSIKEFRYRILDGMPVEFESIGLLTPIKIADGKFKDIMCEYHSQFREFSKELSSSIENIKKSTDNSEIADFNQVSTKSKIAISCMPKLEFQCFANAVFGSEDTPCLCYGKMTDGSVPMSLTINHALVDGSHIVTLFEKIQYNFNKPQSL